MCGGAKAALGGAGEAEAALKQVGTGFHQQQQHQQLMLVLRGSRSAVGRQQGSATGFASPARALSWMGSEPSQPYLCQSGPAMECQQGSRKTTAGSLSACCLTALTHMREASSPPKTDIVTIPALRFCPNQAHLHNAHSEILYVHCVPRKSLTRMKKNPDGNLFEGLDPE